MYVLVADDNLAVDLPDEDRIDLFRAQSLDDCPKLAAFTFPVCGIAIERVRAQVGIDANPDAPANCVRHRTQRAGFPKSLFEKYQAASRLSIKRVIATYTNVSLVLGNSS